MSDIVFTKFHLKKSGGLEKYSLKIINNYLEKNYSVTLLTTAITSNLENVRNLTIIFIKIPKILNFFKIKLFDIKCKKWIKQNKSKIVFSLDRSSLYTHTRLGNGLHLTYLKRKKLFLNNFQFFLNFLNPKNWTILNMEKKGFYQSDVKKIIVNSSMVKHELLNKYKISKSKIEVIHNGVDFYKVENEFNNWENEKKATLKKFGLDLNDFHFIFIGNDYKRKGLMPLLKAFSNLKEKPFHLSVIGKEKKILNFKKVVKKLDLEKKVSFFGKRDDIITFYQLADALIIPSFYDPFSNVAIEALSMGVFVITSQFNGAKEIITCENGLVVDILDTNKLTKALESTISTKKDSIRAKIIRNSVNHLDFSKQMDKLTKAIDI